MNTSKPEILILGAGFAGLSAARVLARADANITLIDQNNHFTFQPLLYQVATAQLGVQELTRNIRSILRRQPSVQFQLGRVSDISREPRTVTLEGGTVLPYDYLILASGSVYNHFGTPGVSQHAHFLKSLTQAVNLRSTVLARFEAAATDPSLIDRGELDFVIVGGGPTGVELTGALLELFTKVLPADYPGLDTSRARVHLVEMLPHLLGPFSEKSRQHAEAVLRRRGAVMHVGVGLKSMTPAGVELADGTFLPARTVVFAAGVRGSKLAGTLGTKVGRGNRLSVNDDLSLPGLPHVFAAGDIVGAVGPEERVFPQTAQPAIQQGRFAAQQLKRRIKQQETGRFEYRDKGSMAMVTRNSGVAELSRSMGGFQLRGFIGWLAWVFLHLLYLPGFRNRFFAAITWLIAWLTHDRHARTITPMVDGPGDSESREP